VEIKMNYVIVRVKHNTYHDLSNGTGISATFFWTNGTCTYRRHYYNVSIGSFNRLFSMDKIPGYTIEMLRSEDFLAFKVMKGGTK